MNLYILPPLVSMVFYSVLLFIVMQNRPNKVTRIFTFYLFTAWYFSFGIFMILCDFFPALTRLWIFGPAVSSVLTIVIYYHFVCLFTIGKTGRDVWAGYGLVLFLLCPLIGLGYFPLSMELNNTGGLDINYGYYTFMYTMIGLFFGTSSFIRLITRLKALKDRKERNKIGYLLTGFALFTVFSIRECIPPLPDFPLTQIGHCLNGFFITMTILKYQLFDLRIVIRKGMVYFFITIFTLCFYFAIFAFVTSIIDKWVSVPVYGTVTISAIIMALIFTPIKTWFERVVDRLFFGEAYVYRRIVLNFASTMGNILELNELSKKMLEPVARSVNSSRASLLIREDDQFVDQFVYQQNKNSTVIPVQIRADSSIITWLVRNNKSLNCEYIDITPELKGVWEIDRNGLKVAEIEFLFPMVNKGNLVGVLALAKKEPAGYYSQDDINLIENLCLQASVVLGNTQLYDQAQRRANLDELTGLSNHRYFHERINEEIERCSRFGDIFSLLSIDVDQFKSYNDINGHLAGDKVLQQIATVIKDSVRKVDICFRYGGDEFAVLLPKATLIDSQRIGERVRSKMEEAMDILGIPLTCSIGISCWPTDGTLREELIKAADAALYYAKYSGKNQICISSVVASANGSSPQLKQNSSKAILNTIYALAATVDAKDHYTYGHSRKVSRYATEIAIALGFPRAKVNALRNAALLHDIGKIGIPDSILNKKASLEAEDWNAIHSHPDLGVSILKNVDSLSDCLAAVKYHHEHYNGKGYPSHLCGENIPLDARILTVADSFDAMTSSRPYRKPFTVEAALDELKRCSGTQFDPNIVEIFVKIKTSVVDETVESLNST
jgi:diguanylate cyclase (GGDEF)-like protein/putative nucleotidyltransferase with HDIG domain